MRGLPASPACQALQINTIPSEETTRQRLDYLGVDIAASSMVMEESANMLKSVGAQPTPAFTGHVPLDVDVSPHDNSNTRKEGVERTYKGVDGYAPIYAYIGGEGYVCNVELREGSCHSQCGGTVEFLEDTLSLGKQITPGKLLVRMDSGNDSLDNIKLFLDENVDYIIKLMCRHGGQAWRSREATSSACTGNTRPVNSFILNQKQYRVGTVPKRKILHKRGHSEAGGLGIGCGQRR